MDNLYRKLPSPALTRLMRRASEAEQYLRRVAGFASQHGVDASEVVEAVSALSAVVESCACELAAKRGPIVGARRRPGDRGRD